jgi:glycosyltransferase involved in cell wall biosynthesis
MEGIGYFTYETLKRIVIANPDIEFHFLFDRAYDEMFIFADNVKPVVLFPPARHPFLWYWWFDRSVAGYLNKNKFDLFLSPDGYCSLRSDTPTVAVMHDIAYEHYPDFVPLLTMMYYKYFMPRFAHHAARIATVSEYSKADIVKYYGIPDSKIDVVYSAAKDVFAPITTAEQDVLKAKYTGGKPYLIFVGSIHPRKNLKNMLLAFDEHRKSVPDSVLKFVVAGAFGWQNSELKTVIDNMQYKDDIVFLGRQPLDELVKLVASAFCLMYLSVFEGFGVPPLEAMQCGVPAITSPISSLPEICGDAALYADPLDVDAISLAITTLWDSPTLRSALRDRGREHCRQYTWDRTARLLWDSCLKVLNT